MAKKQFNVTTNRFTARPRSKRLREQGFTGAEATGTRIGVSVPAESDGHTHNNKLSLDTLSVDTDDYIYVAQKHEGDELAQARKARSGDADNATLWNGKDSGDYLDQGVRSFDDVTFASVTLKDIVLSRLADASRYVLRLCDKALHNNVLLKLFGVQAEEVEADRITAGSATLREGATSETFRQNGFSGEGFGIVQDADGQWTMETDRLVVRRSMDVNEVVVNQITHVGGRQIYSCAGMEATRVEDLETASDPAARKAAWRVYMDTKQGARPNLFAVGDLAYCQRFASDNFEYKFYWRAVVAVGEDYIDLSKTDCANGSTGTPEPGDNIAQVGNRSDKGRQAMLEIDMLHGGQMVQYAGIDGYSFAGRNVVGQGYDSQQKKAYFYVCGDMQLGDRELGPDANYIVFQQREGDTKRRLHINGSIQLGANSSGLQNLTEWNAAQRQIDRAEEKAVQTEAYLNQMNDDRVFDTMEKQIIRTQWESISGTNTTNTPLPEITTSRGSYHQIHTLGQNAGVSVETLERAAEALRTYLDQFQLYVNEHTPNFSREQMSKLFIAYYGAEKDVHTAATEKAAADSIRIGVNIANNTHEAYVEAHNGYPAAKLDHTLMRGQTITSRVTLRGEAAQADNLGYEIQVHFTDGTNQWLSYYTQITERGNFEKTYEFTDTVRDKEIEFANIYPVFRADTTGKLFIRHEFVGIGTKIPSTWSPSTADLKAHSQELVDGIEVSSRNLVCASGQVTIPARETNNWNFEGLPLTVEVEGGDELALSVESIEVLAGAPATFQAIIYDNANAGQLSTESAALTADKRTFVFRIKEGVEKQTARLLLYAGWWGQTAGNSVRYNKVMLVRGNKPALAWTEAPEDVQARIAAAQQAIDQAEEVLSRWASDAFLSPAEITGLLEIWKDINTEYSYLISEAERYGVSTSSYTQAYEKVRTAANYFTGHRTRGIGIATGTEGLNHYNAFNRYRSERNRLQQSLQGEANGLLQKTMIDARELDGNTYYPVIMELIPSERAEIKVTMSQPYSSTVPQAWWIPSGTTCTCQAAWSACAGRSGFAVNRIIDDFQFNGNALDGKSPVGSIGQVESPPHYEYFYVRGGGQYDVTTTHAFSIRLQTSPAEAGLELKTDVAVPQSLPAIVRDMNDDGIFDLAEKQSVRTLWENISGTPATDTAVSPTNSRGLYQRIRRRALEAEVPVASLDSAVENLRTYLDHIGLYAPTSTPDFRRESMASQFSRYYTLASETEYAISQKLADVKIGGTNLLQGTRDFAPAHWRGNGTVVDETFQGLSVLYYDAAGASEFMELAVQTGCFFASSTEYTLSFYAKGRGDLCSYCAGGDTGVNQKVLNTNGNNKGYTGSDTYNVYTLGSDWKRFFITFRTHADVSTADERQVLFRLFAGNAASICGIQLEKGNRPSDYAPAPDDLRMKVDSMSYLEDTFQGSTTDLGKGVVLTSFVGLREDEKIVAGMSNGANFPFIFAKAGGIANAQTADFVIASEGWLRQKGKKGSTTLNDGAITFERLSGNSYVRSMSVTPAIEKINAANVHPFINIISGPAQEATATVSTGYCYDFMHAGSQPSSLKGTARLSGVMENLGPATYSIPKFVFQFVANPISLSGKAQVKGTLTGRLINTTTGLPISGYGPVQSFDLSLTTASVARSFTFSATTLSNVPTGSYYLELQVSGSITVSGSMTTNNLISISIQQTTPGTAKATWTTLSANSAIFGNGLLYSSSSSQYAGLMTTDSESVLAMRSGNQGVRMDSKGLGRWHSGNGQWDYSGVLCAGSISSSGTITNQCGIIKCTGYKRSDLSLAIQHSLGHTNYFVMATVHGAADWNKCHCVLLNKRTTTFDLRVIDSGTGNNGVERDLDFMIYGPRA